MKNNIILRENRRSSHYISGFIIRATVIIAPTMAKAYDIYGTIIIASRPVAIIFCGAINPERRYDRAVKLLL